MYRFWPESLGAMNALACLSIRWSLIDAIYAKGRGTIILYYCSYSTTPEFLHAFYNKTRGLAYLFVCVDAFCLRQHL